MAFSFEHLREFIQKRMRMSHIYQPVMIRELLTRGGKASIRNIAAAFLGPRPCTPGVKATQSMSQAGWSAAPDATSVVSR
jgi:hypothetical protein